MPGETIYPTANSTATTDTEKGKQLDQEIRDMIAALTKRLAELQHIHKPSTTSNHGDAHVDSSHHHPLSHHNADQHGQQIITLAGTNQGATMQGELMDDKLATPEDADEPYDALGAYVNSNFQAINNSIMIGGSYATNDPGVHMDVSDVFDHHQLGHHDHHHHDQTHGHAYEKKGMKKNKKDKANGKSQLHHSETSD